MKTLLLILLLTLTGCSINTYKEKLTLYQNSQEVAVYESELTQILVVYFTTAKQIDHRGPLSSMSVGVIESYPDPNTASAIVEAVGTWMRVGL